MIQQETFQIALAYSYKNNFFFFKNNFQTIIENIKFNDNFLYYDESYEAAGAMLLDSPDDFIMTNSIFEVLIIFMPL